MFFCKKCGEAKQWPESMVKSYGRCEVCEEVAICNDIPAGRLASHDALQAALRRTRDE